MPEQTTLRAYLEKRIAERQQAAQEHYEQWQRHIGAIGELVSLLNELPADPPAEPEQKG